MSRKTKTIDFLQEYNREMLRSAFVSVFWSVITEKKRKGFTLSALAEKLDVHKSVVSRWFSGRSPNWSLNTISDVANALDLHVKVTAVDRQSGKVFDEKGDIQIPSIGEKAHAKSIEEIEQRRYFKSVEEARKSYSRNSKQQHVLMLPPLIDSASTDGNIPISHQVLPNSFIRHGWETTQ